MPVLESRPVHQVERDTVADDGVVDQRIDRSDPTQERLATYKVSAKVSPEGRIVDLNMKKVVK